MAIDKNAAPRGVSHILFDFFGTLVDYSDSRTEQGYHATHRLLQSFGISFTYSEFLRLWENEAEQFDARSALDNAEFSMDDVSRAFLTKLLRRPPAISEYRALTECYLREWNTGVVYPAAAVELVKFLSVSFGLAIVTNTHEATLVPNHLTAMGIAGCFKTVVTSVEVGWRKPHPAIYSEACSQLEISPQAAVFVGDSYWPDYIGPIAAGMSAFLLDPKEKYDVADGRRLYSLRELPRKLGIYHNLA